jgi:hypothetical protein
LASGAAGAQREGRPFRLVGELGSARLLEAAAAEGEGAKLPAFEMVGYTGGPMFIGYYGRVMVDLAGVAFANPIRVLRDHDSGQVVGHGEAKAVKGRIVASGVVSGAGPAAAEVVASGKNGFPWQSSIGMDPSTLVLEDVRAGASTKVNGRTVKGPITVVRSGVVREISFVALGADGQTSGSIAASMKEEDMDPKFKAWLQGKGIDPEGLEEKRLSELKAEYDAETGAAAGAAASGGEPENASGRAPVNEGQADPLQAAQTAVATERTRVAAIERGYMAAVNAGWCSAKETRERVQELRASAIAEGWDESRFNREVLKASYAAVRPVGPGLQRSEPGSDARALEAAACMQAQLPQSRLERDYDARTLEAAQRMRRIPLRALMAEAAALDGIVLSRREEGTDRWIRAAATSLSLTGILSNVAHKAMLEAYLAPQSVVRRIFSISQVSDFKQHTRYRLTSDFTFKKVVAGGELKHGDVDEQSFTQQAETYGIFFELDRQMIINDDMGAFLRIPRAIGRGAALALERAGFTLILDNTGTFFGSGNGNYSSGAGTALGETALTTAVGLMEKMTDTRGEPVLVLPKFLLVPPELKATAERLYKSQNLIVTALGATNAAAVQGEANIHAGKYEPLSSPYLSATGFHGSVSSTGWYLFADPADIAAFDLAFLNGVDTPTIEQVGLPSNRLGIGFRGYQDFGVAQQDPRGAVLMAGA